ncbi:MAG: DUF3791 domain-containing protein [Lachnospiraceae bacterium]|nr:DUF3791 domain-containing protein [Lachnospiraceae bacterium]
MTKEGNFLTYCVEQYIYEKNMTGRQVMNLFSRYDVLPYLYSSSDPLHEAKAKFIVEDIDIYIDACKKVM